MQMHASSCQEAPTVTGLFHICGDAHVKIIKVRATWHAIGDGGGIELANLACAGRLLGAILVKN